MSAFAVLRIVGFEELGNSDTFSTATLELRLEQSGMESPLLLQVTDIDTRKIGVIEKESSFVPAVRHVTSTSSRGSRMRQERHDDSDFDLDD